MLLATLKYLKNIHNGFRETSSIPHIDPDIVLSHPYGHLHGHFAANMPADPYFADTVVLPC